MGKDYFPSIPGSSNNAAVENVIIEGPIVTWPPIPPYSQRIANLIVRGTLILEADTTLRVSGTVYIAPTGKIIGKKPDGSAVNLTVYSAGPVIIHGLIDLSGKDGVGFTSSASGWSAPAKDLAGNGGNLTILSRALSPLQIPTIVTQGGDVGLVDYDLLESRIDPTQQNLLLNALIGKGGTGGDVFIQGPPNGLIVFSGIKDKPNPLPIACDYAGSVSNTKDPGLIFPVNSIPQGIGQRKYESSRSVSCSAQMQEKQPEYHPTRGLARTFGRGIVTSGGMGASAKKSITQSPSGSNGGDGGRIKIEFAKAPFPIVQSGTIRFRDVSLITGAGTGFLKTRINWAPYKGLDALIDSPVVQITGGSGGKGDTGAYVRMINQFTVVAKSGGDGGQGGTAGDITIDRTAKIYPEPDSVCKKKNVLGHNGVAAVKTLLDNIGEARTFC